MIQKISFSVLQKFLIYDIIITSLNMKEYISMQNLIWNKYNFEFSYFI